MPRRFNANRRRADTKASRRRTIKLRVLGEKRAAAAASLHRPQAATYAWNQQSPDGDAA